MEAQHASSDLDETIAIVAEEFGLDPTDVRYELETISMRIRQYGPVPSEVRLQQLAAEFAVDPEEIRAEAEQIHARLAARGVVL